MMDNELNIEGATPSEEGKPKKKDDYLYLGNF